MSGDATASVKGFNFQRWYGVYNLLLDYSDKKEYKYIKEEGNEDIDLITENNKIYSIQVKYKNSGKESYTPDLKDDFKKVIKRGLKNNDIILNIEYYLAGEIEYRKILKKSFDNKQYENLRKYTIILLICEYFKTYKQEGLKNKNIKKLDILSDFKISILDNKNNELDNLFKEYDGYKNKKYINNEEYDNYFDILYDKTKSKQFFMKINPIKGWLYSELKNEILNLIGVVFNEFIINISDENKDLKKELIQYRIFNYFENNLFNKNEKMVIKNVIKDVKEMISTLTNINFIIEDLFKSYNIKIINAINYNDENNGNNIKILNILKEIKGLNKHKIINYEKLAINIDLLNRKYEKLTSKEVKYIKNEILDFFIEYIKINGNDENNNSIKLALTYFYRYVYENRQSIPYTKTKIFEDLLDYEPIHDYVKDD